MVKYLLLDFSDPEIPMDPDDIRSVPKIDTISFFFAMQQFPHYVLWLKGNDKFLKKC